MTFHEVGAWDSIVDIVLAAWLIDASGVSNWMIGPIPIGSGRVTTQHGPLPVPAPATVELLRDLTIIDDGIGGERVTPTGAAILAHLEATSSGSAIAGKMTAQGFGFGSRQLPGISNMLRVTVIESEPTTLFERIGIIEFEIDDQTPEDLATGLDHLRSTEGVLDVVQMPVIGKKGRTMASIRLLVRSEAKDQIMDNCFTETTTLGLRWSEVERRVLKRENRLVAGDIGVKVTMRPDGGRTAKAENDDIAECGGADQREETRQQAERQALSDDD